MARTIDIVVPVYNGEKHVRACIDSILGNTLLPYRIVLVDDASDEVPLLDLLRQYGARDDCKLIRRKTNGGYVSAVNLGIKASKTRDVVLLNSDTVVTSGWLERLHHCVYHMENIGSASPLTSYGSMFSVPHANQNNPLPPGVDVEGMQRLVSFFSDRKYPVVPTSHGFCMYIRRATLKQVGSFDERAFARGYGEENDFCMRASEQGWLHVVDDVNYVWHLGQASFGSERTDLIKEHRALLDARYPYYTKLVRDWVKDDPLADLRDRLSSALASTNACQGKGAGPHVLTLVHDGAGGTVETNNDLMDSLVDRCRFSCIRSDRQNWQFELWNCARQNFRLERSLHLMDIHNPKVAQIAEEILSEHRVDLLHIRHLLAQSFDWVEQAWRLKIPVLMSLHDYYLVCPNIQLIDNRGDYCGGRCNQDPEDCSLNRRWFEVRPRLKGQYLASWRRQVGEMLEKVSGFVTTSDSAKSIFCEHYPELKKRPFWVVPHGRDFESWSKSNVEFELPLRIVSFGALNESKGIHLLNGLATKLDSSLVELHVLGRISRPLHPRIFYHGEYQREELPKRIVDISPHAALFLSIWPETFCHVLTEAWALGLPAAVSPLGALKERMEIEGAGWVLDDFSVGGIVEQLERIANDFQDWRKKKDLAERLELRSCVDMASDYSAIYEELIEQAGGRKSVLDGWGRRSMGAARMRYERWSRMKAPYKWMKLELGEVANREFLEAQAGDFMRRAKQNWVKPVLSKSPLAYALGKEGYSWLNRFVFGRGRGS